MCQCIAVGGSYVVRDGRELVAECVNVFIVLLLFDISINALEIKNNSNILVL